MSNILLQNALIESAGWAPDQQRRPYRIGIIESSAPVRAQIARLLRSSGYRVIAISDTYDGAAAGGDEEGSDLVLLGVERIEDGLAICHKIRAASAVPLIMVAPSSAEGDCIAALDAGADDYLSKPFSAGELIARIRAVLKRATRQTGEPQAGGGEWLCFSGWSYHAARQELYAPDGHAVLLTAAEHELLFTLLHHPLRPLGRENLLELTHQRIATSSDRSIDVLMSRLRRKLGDRRDARSLIKTIRGVGYMFSGEVKAASRPDCALPTERTGETLSE